MNVTKATVVLEEVTVMADELAPRPVPSQSDDEERAILFLQSPFGDAPDQREHQWAVDYVVEHAEQVHPRLLALLQSSSASNPYAIIEILPVLGRPESVPVLADLMQTGPPNIVQAAANALGRHPDGRAIDPLLDGIRSPRVEIVSASADALYDRGDDAACPVLLPALNHVDPITRYHLIQAAAGLNCLDSETLATIAQNDSDEDVRNLAQRTIEQQGH